MRTLSFQTKILSGFLVLFFLLVFFGWKMVQFSQEAEEDARQIVHTHEVRETLELVFSTLIDIQSSARGYVISANPEFLGPFELGIKTIDQQIATLRMLTSDNLRQQTKIDTLEKLVAKKLEWDKGIVQTLRTEGRAAAASMVASEIGRLQMERIRSLISEMRNEENRLLHERREEASASASKTRLLLYGSLLIMLTLIVALFVVTQHYRTMMEKTNTLLEKKVEERTAKLAASEREFRDLADSALIGIYRSTLKGEILYANATLARMMGFASPAELIRDGAIARYRDPADWQAFIEKLQRDGKVESYETVLLNKSGAPLYALLSAQINGDIITGTMLDITERKRAEEALRESEKRLKEAQRVAHIGDWELDLRSNVLTWSDEIYRIFGIEPQTFKASYEAFLEAIHPDDREMVNRAYTDSLKNKTPYSIDHRLLMKDGSVKFVHEQCETHYDEQGQPIRSIGTVQDITERKQAEKVLIENEKIFRLIANNSPDIIFSQNVDLIYDRIINPAPPLTPEDVVGKTDFDLLPLPQAQLLTELKRKVITTGEAIHEELLLSPGGIPRWYDVLYNPAYDENGRIVGIISYSRDITERKRAEEELEQIRVMLSEAQRLAHCGSYEYILETGETIWSDEQFRIYGLTPGQSSPNYTELTQKFLHPDDAANVMQKSAAAVQSGLPYEIEYRIIRPDGSIRYIYDVAQPYFDTQGKPFKYIGASLDITERKRSEEKFKTLLESAPDAIVIANSEGKIVQVNTQTERLFGFTRAELYGQSVEILIPQRFHAAHSKHRAAYFAAPSARPMGIGLELFGRHKDGSEFPVDVGLNMLEANDEGHFVMAVIRDITMHKRAEADRLAREVAERANQAKSVFLSRISHEFRTPLNAILGFAQLLEMDPLKPDQLQNVRNILKSGRHLLSLINEMLDIARIESGRMTLSPETVHLEEALLPSIELIRPLATQRGISISVKLPSSKDIFITADLQRLKQVLLNLLSNAVKYNRDNGSIHVSTSLLADGFLRLAIMDTGEGIPTEKMHRLFQTFDRLDLDNTQSEGTGLGLALSKGLMEVMGGRIGAESELGKGTTFWIDLPLTTEQTEAIVMAEVDEHLKSFPASYKGVILHVEDNLANVQLLEKAISRIEGVKLVTAMQGRMALDLAEQHQPSLILLDLHLPDLNGLDVLRRLQENPKTKHIPVVMMSAEVSSRKIQEALAAGVHRYLTKPINVTEFLQMIKEVFTG